MYAQQLGFTTSWKMLTRDKGWIKPILMLTLVGWIPILGQIAILGYGLEWARLTAWGVDAAPKQRGVAYGKVLATGGIAFLVMLTMGLVTGIVDTILFGRWYSITSLPFGSSIFADSVITLAGDVTSVLGIAVLRSSPRRCCARRSTTASARDGASTACSRWSCAIPAGSSMRMRSPSSAGS